MRKAKSSLYQIRLYSQRNLKSMDDRQSFFLALFLLSQSLYVWAPFFGTLHFCGYFLHIVDSRQFRSMLQILLQRVWPRNENAITVPSIFLSPGLMSAFCCMVGGRENCFCFHNIEKTRGLCLGRKVAPPASQKLSATRCYLHCVS